MAEKDIPRIYTFREPGWRTKIVDLPPEPLVVTGDNPASVIAGMAIRDSLRKGNPLDIPALKIRFVVRRH